MSPKQPFHSKYKASTRFTVKNFFTPSPSPSQKPWMQNPFLLPKGKIRRPLQKKNPPVSGGKAESSGRIAYFPDPGKNHPRQNSKKKSN